MIGLAIGAAILLLLGGAVAFVIWKVVDTVEEVADGVTVGDVECPTSEDVSEIVGYDVDLATSGSIVVAAGCTYTSADANGGAGVSIATGAGLIDDDVLADLATSAEQAGTEATPIDVGDDGKAYGSETRSEAATKVDDQIVEVEIFSQSTEPIGDKRDAAVELLEAYIALNF